MGSEQMGSRRIADASPRRLDVEPDWPHVDIADGAIQATPSVRAPCRPRPARPSNEPTRPSKGWRSATLSPIADLFFPLLSTVNSPRSVSAAGGRYTVSLGAVPPGMHPVIPRAPAHGAPRAHKGGARHGEDADVVPFAARAACTALPQPHASLQRTGDGKRVRSWWVPSCAVASNVWHGSADTRRDLAQGLLGGHGPRMAAGALPGLVPGDGPGSMPRGNCILSFAAGSFSSLSSF